MLCRFGGSVGHDAHLLYTLSALQILALLDRMELLGGEEGTETGAGAGKNKHRVAQYVAQLQQPDGSFAGDQWGKYVVHLDVKQFNN